MSRPTEEQIVKYNQPEPEEQPTIPHTTDAINAM